MGLFEKLKNGLKKTARPFSEGLRSFLKSGAEFSSADFAALEEKLVSADVGAPTAQQLVWEVQSLLKKSSSSDPFQMAQCLRKAILERLLKIPLPPLLPHPVVVLLMGVNGVGKTTTAGKLAARFALDGKKVLLAAGDTFRAAAEEQLTEWAGRAKVEVVRGSHGSSPSAVVFDGLKLGLSRGMDCVVVDTAGRLHTRSNLMEELKKITRVSEKAAPGISQEKWLVLDANTGQNALNQAREFHQGVGLTGVIITKLDGTAKGGIVLALAEQLPLPVRYLGVGEGLDDLITYDPELFVKAFIPEPI